MAYKQVTYGGWTFAYHKMSVTQTPRYGDNGIDLAGIQYNFKIQGWFTAKTEADFAVLIAKTNAYLAKPRQGFLVQWSPDNATWSTLYSFDGIGEDTVWGPLPGTMNIETISGGKAAFFTWDLKVESKRCWDISCNPFDRPSDVLTISRKYQFDVGPDGLTTRVISGRLEIAADSVMSNKPADAYRYLVDVATPTNFKREGSTYTQSPDGRFLEYSITDIERTWTLPAPVTSGQANWQVTVQGVGLIADYRLSGTFSAPSTVSKSTILDQILQLASNRFPSDPSFNLIPMEKMISESVYENSVSFAFSAKGSIGPTQNVFDPNTGYATFGTAPANSTGISPPIGTYGGDGVNGNSGVTGGIPTPYDACTPPAGGTPYGSTGSPPAPPTGTPTTTGDPGGSAGTSGSDPVDTSTDVSTGHQQAPYTSYRETISWEADNGFKLFYPKVAGAAPIVQQTRNPKLFVIQCGYAKRLANTPDNAPSAPAPIYGSGKVVMHAPIVRPGNPVPVGDSSTWNEYSVEWAYKMEWIGAFSSGDTLAIQYPVDPRRSSSPDSSGPAMPSIPSGLIQAPE